MCAQELKHILSIIDKVRFEKVIDVPYVSLSVESLRFRSFAQHCFFEDHS